MAVLHENQTPARPTDTGRQQNSRQKIFISKANKALSGDAPADGHADLGAETPLRLVTNLAHGVAKKVPHVALSPSLHPASPRKVPKRRDAEEDGMAGLGINPDV